MLITCNIETLENATISNSVTLVPRLEYSVNLLDGIIEILKKKRHELKKLNKFLVTDFDETDMAHLKAIELERITSFSLDLLSQIKKRIGKISGVNSIPEILPTSIPLVRTVSAQLFDFLPNCSQKLSELSVHLGSIVLDSAVLTKARFDFSQSNEKSSILLNEVKLMVDSKINKQYPNLDFSKACNNWQY
ncbi:MAG TPA: hypothetical protein OQH54_04950 [Nitrosopumilus sp.]|nr:hypothetical protein [Thermoproteota archaeon]HJJ23046.1 hypothetical protein [Nitrosopumilus sp.]